MDEQTYDTRAFTIITNFNNIILREWYLSVEKYL